MLEGEKTGFATCGKERGRVGACEWPFFGEDVRDWDVSGKKGGGPD